MLHRRVRISPSMVVAFVALLLALGGTSYAVTRLPARSVGPKQLRPQAVRRVAIQNNAINGAKVAKDSLTGADIQESSLTGVAAAASATNATNATNSAHSGSSAAVDKVSYRGVNATIPAATVTPTPADPTATTAGTAAASAACDAGQRVVGGGGRVEDAAETSIGDSYPDAGGTTWTVHADNNDTAAAHGFTVFAICVPAGTVG